MGRCRGQRRHQARAARRYGRGDGETAAVVSTKMGYSTGREEQTIIFVACRGRMTHGTSMILLLLAWSGSHRFVLDELIWMTGPRVMTGNRASSTTYPGALTRMTTCKTCAGRTYYQYGLPGTDLDLFTGDILCSWPHLLAILPPAQGLARITHLGDGFGHGSACSDDDHTRTDKKHLP